MLRFSIGSHAILPTPLFGDLNFARNGTDNRTCRCEAEETQDNVGVPCFELLWDFEDVPGARAVIECARQRLDVDERDIAAGRHDKQRPGPPPDFMLHLRLQHGGHSRLSSDLRIHYGRRLRGSEASLRLHDGDVLVRELRQYRADEAENAAGEKLKQKRNHVRTPSQRRRDYKQAAVGQAGRPRLVSWSRTA